MFLLDSPRTGILTLTNTLINLTSLLCSFTSCAVSECSLLAVRLKTVQAGASRLRAQETAGMLKICFGSHQLGKRVFFCVLQSTIGSDHPVLMGTFFITLGSECIIFKPVSTYKTAKVNICKDTSNP